MARKKTSEFEDMTLRELKAYSDIHPAEGLRIAKVCVETKKHSATNYWKYRREEVMNIIIPGFSKDDITNNNLQN